MIKYIIDRIDDDKCVVTIEEVFGPGLTRHMYVLNKKQNERFYKLQAELREILKIKDITNNMDFK